MILQKEIEISSAYNRTYKEFLSLLAGRGVKKTGRAIVSGTKIVPEVISHKADIVSGWIASPKHGPAPFDLPENVPRYRLSTLLFRDLDINGTGYPLLLVDIPVLDSYDNSMLFSGVTLFVPFQDPRNVGAVIRSAAAFDVSTVVLLKESANPYHQKSIRAAGTALFYTRLLAGPSIDDLENIRRPVIALDAGGDSIHDFTFPDKFILLPGLEGGGLPQNCNPDTVLSIPMNPEVESLNAAVAVSVALFAWKRQTGG